MTAALVFDTGLALLVVAVAVWTSAAGSAFAAVVGFVAFGLLLALAWVRLAAVDVALTEVAVGSGITGALLITAAARLRPTEPRSAAERPRVAMRVAAGALGFAVFAGLAALVLLPTDPAPTLAPEAAVHLPELGVGNAVTAVLLAYRALDTLLEKVVLLLALIGVWSLAPDRFWGGAPALRPGTPPGGELTLLGRLLPPAGIVVGVYILWVGAIAPGGAFQGSAILAAMWLLVMIAGLQAVPQTSQRRLRLVIVAGPAVFLAVGFAGFALPNGFLSYPAAFAKPLIIVVEVVLTLSIAAILGLLVAGPSERERQR
jgi:multisubunit Na+/H+ antiporter MnhB subunit